MTKPHISLLPTCLGNMKYECMKRFPPFISKLQYLNFHFALVAFLLLLLSYLNLNLFFIDKSSKGSCMFFTCTAVKLNVKEPGCT